MPIAITSEQRAFAASIQRWAAGAGTHADIRNRETGGGDDARHRRALAELGVFALGLPEAVGGAGDMTDLAVALEAVTDALVPGPVMPTVLAAVLLAQHADHPMVKGLLPAIVSGDATVAVAWGLAAGHAHGAPRGGHSGHGPVLGAGATSHLLLPHGDGFVLIESADPAVHTHALRPLDFSRTLAEVSLADGAWSADLVLPLGADVVRDTAALLASIEAAAVAAWSVRVATDYAKVREQFGRPIGMFQAVKHLCATMLARSERASAVAWDASVAYGRSPDEFPLAVAVAASVALDAALENAKDCIQVLGGIGFTWEHDAHLYLRRAVVLRQLLGDGWRQRAAMLTLSGARRWLRVETVDSLPETVRARLAQIADLPVDERRAALADAGLLTPSWPKPYGLAASAGEQLAIDEAMAELDIVRPDIKIAGWALPTIIAHGTDAQRERFVGPSLRGELIWCQLFSEPEAGSDLASLRTRARRVDGGWLLTGQKVWTSLAHEAHWAICLARTDAEAPKHKGIGYFLLKMDSPGLEIRPLREITGEALFNEVFLDDVFVPDRDMVGAPGDGWKLARGTLENERVAIGRGSSLGEALERVIETVRVTGTAEDPAVLDRVGALVGDGLAMSTMELRATLHRLAGEPAGAESAVRKLVGVAQRQAVAEAALLLGGASGAAISDANAAVVRDFLSSRCLSIAGGTTQILLTLVAERVLGLPREGAS